MGDFTTPVNLEDPQVLKMYLDTLSAAIQNVTVLTSSLAAAQGKFTGISTDPAFIEFVDSTQKLNAEIKSLVEGNLETIEKQSSDLSYVIEQFGTNYEQNQAASWYGLTVGAGNILTGFTVGALDYDTSSYGNEDSVFGIHANRFFIGRSPTTQDELDYLADKDQDFLTLYNETGEAIPAFGIDWTGTGYEIFFNGVVSFNNVDTGYTDGTGNTIIDGGQIKTASITTNNIALGTGIVDGYIQSSDFTSIGGAGFRLKSNAAGTEEDPTIYGAYIVGSTISSTTSLIFNSVQVRSTNPNNYGKVTHSIYNSGYFYGPDYSSGFLETRVCNTTGQIIVSGNCDGYFTGLYTKSVTVYLEYSISGGAWVTMESQNSVYWSAVEAAVVPVHITLYSTLSSSLVTASNNITFRVRYVSSGFTYINSAWLATITN